MNRQLQLIFYSHVQKEVPNLLKIRNIYYITNIDYSGHKHTSLKIKFSTEIYLMKISTVRGKTSINKNNLVNLGRWMTF